MTVKSSAASHCKKAMKIGLSLFRRGFNSSKCKTMAKMAVARVKLLRNKREVVIKQMRRDIAMLLDSGQDATARIRVQHVIREQNIMAANELIVLFCELIVARLSIISKQRECPADLKEGISSLIFAGPRCSDIPELLSIRDVFEKKYGRDFVSAATDLRPNAGVNRLLIEKLSVNTPSGETKLKVLKEIAKEYQVQWDTNESEVELLKPPEERIEGPKSFVSATSLPLKPDSKQSSEPDNATNRVEGNNSMTSFHELASAAGAAAEKAVAAAQAAAFLAASHDDQRMPKTKINSKYSPSFEQSLNYGNKKIFRRQSYNCQRENIDIKFDEADCDEEIEMEEPSAKYNRRHSYNAPPPPAESGVRYDEYSDDGSGQEEEAGPPARPAPQAPARRVHPKLPDYDALTARFESLKHHKPK